VSELKSVSGSNKLPYGTLASGTEGIKDAISGFEDACVIIFLTKPLFSVWLDVNIPFFFFFDIDGNPTSKTSGYHPSCTMPLPRRVGPSSGTPYPRHHQRTALPPRLSPGPVLSRIQGWSRTPSTGSTRTSRPHRPARTRLRDRWARASARPRQRRPSARAMRAKPVWARR
jgi:hypothetical protein